MLVEMPQGEAFWCDFKIAEAVDLLSHGAALGLGDLEVIEIGTSSA